MKNLALIFSFIIISIVSSNAQNINSISKNDDNIESSTELYNSINQDFENYYNNQIETEQNEDLLMESIYNELFKEYFISKQIKKEIEEENNNNNIYLTILDDFMKK